MRRNGQHARSSMLVYKLQLALAGKTHLKYLRPCHMVSFLVAVN